MQQDDIVLLGYPCQLGHPAQHFIAVAVGIGSGRDEEEKMWI
jgi:hypothetical protein